MAMSDAMKKRITAAIPAGALAIAVAMLGGHDGLEGRRYVAYKDVVGVWTVCDGHTGSDIIKGRRYTDQECDQLLETDLIPVKRAVDAVVKVKIKETTRGAIYSFVYNVGTTAFRNSRLLRLLNAGERAGACAALRQWIYAGGKVWRGLMTRREIEVEVCTWGGV